jgi:recombination protein RecA
MGDQKKIDKVVGKLRQSFGDAVIPKTYNDERIIVPTGILSLDMMTGVGGFPVGHVVELYGPEGAGKTSVAFHLLAQAQLLEMTAFFVDMEHKADPRYMAACGVDHAALVMIRPENGAQAFDAVEAIVKASVPAAIVVDSVAALVPPSEQDSEAGDISVGGVARLMSRNLRRLRPKIGLSDVLVLFINQVRAGIGRFVPLEVQPGGKALLSYASFRARMARKGWVKVGGKEVGIESRLAMRKNCLGVPGMREATISILDGEGVMLEADLLAIAVERGIVEKTEKGGWHTWGDIFKVQGANATAFYLRENPEIAEKLRAEILPQKEAKK